MITTQVSSLNATVQKSRAWLNELAELGRLAGEAQAYSVLHAVLHTLRDTLTVDEAAQLGAQLPILLRGVYYEGWKPAAMPVPSRTRQAFLSKVADRLGNSAVDPEAACRAVFTLLTRKITAGEVEDVRRMMHKEVRELWEAR